MTKSWGEVYRLYLRRGYDPGYAAFGADRYVARKERLGKKVPLKGKKSEPDALEGEG